MRRRAGSHMFMAATILLMLSAAVFFAGTAVCRADSGRAQLERDYRERESRMVREIREYLSEQGFQNSGVALTRVVEENGRREYTVTVHHREIDRMTGEEREELARRLSAIGFEDENSSFCHEFLLND